MTKDKAWFDMNELHRSEDEAFDLPESAPDPVDRKSNFSKSKKAHKKAKNPFFPDDQLGNDEPDGNDRK